MRICVIECPKELIQLRYGYRKNRFDSWAIIKMKDTTFQRWKDTIFDSDSHDCLKVAAKIIQPQTPPRIQAPPLPQGPKPRVQSQLQQRQFQSPLPPNTPPLFVQIKPTEIEGISVCFCLFSYF